MGMIKNAFYIAAEKIKSAIIRVRDAMSTFFEKALEMMKTVIEKLKNRIRSAILGASHFLRKIGNKYQEGTKNYTVDEELGEWNEITVTREIDIKDAVRIHERRKMERETSNAQESELFNKLSGNYFKFC